MFHNIGNLFLNFASAPFSNVCTRMSGGWKRNSTIGSDCDCEHVVIKIF